MLYFSEIAVSAVGVERAEEWMWLESAGISQFQVNLFASAPGAYLPSHGRRKMNRREIC